MAEDEGERARRSIDKLTWYGLEPGEQAETDGSMKCRPQDRGDFFRRLRSYRPAKWFAKPKEMSAVECARRGFACVAPDRLECEVCGAEVRFAVDPGSSSWYVGDLSRRTAPLLRTAHSEACGWRSQEVPLHVADFPPHPGPRLREEFHSRINSLLTLPHLPKVDLPAPCRPHFQAVQGAARACPPLSSCDSDGLRLAAFLAGLFGWQASLPPSDPSHPLLVCELCGARGGLWNFSPLPADTPQRQAQETPSTSEAPQSNPHPPPRHADTHKSTDRKASGALCMLPGLPNTIAGGPYSPAAISGSSSHPPAFGPDAHPRPPLFGPR